MKATTEELDGLRAAFILANDGSLEQAIKTEAERSGRPFVFANMTSGDVRHWRTWLNIKAKGPVRVLAELFEGTNVEVTVSVNCRSGVLGGTCQCWRCRRGRGENVTKETEELAAMMAAEADQKRRKP